MTERPNVVLVTWDSVRADHVSCYGYERNTAPTLSRLADRGLVVEDCQVPGVGTPTSFTGSFSGYHTTAMQSCSGPDHWRSANGDLTLLSERVSELGYETGGFHFNTLMSARFGWGRGWDTYLDPIPDGGTDVADGPAGNGGQSAEATGGGLRDAAFDALQRADLANFVAHGRQLLAGEPPTPWEALWPSVTEFLDSAPEPFFLWVLLMDTHHPYYVPPSHHVWPQGSLRRAYAETFVMRRWPGLVGERRETIVNAYDNGIRYADAFLGQLVGALEERGYGDAPLIVHGDHGDHGDLFGEHAPRPYGHPAGPLYDGVTRVPLVLANVGETGRVSGPNTLLDLPSTVLDIAGCNDRPADRPSVLDAPDHDSVIVQNRLGDREWSVAVVGDRWKVLHHADETDRFAAFDRRTDPDEQHDQWGSHPADLETALRDRLVGLRATDGAVGRDRSAGPAETAPEPPSGGVTEQLAGLGYLD